MSRDRNSTPTTTPEGILEQLDRVLSSPLFKRSDRSSKLIQFLVEQAVAGHAARLKEYTLGIEALGKGSSFDPRMDPSVRLEVSRLRTRLDNYYATEGAADPIGIVLAKGSYAPQFETRKLSGASTSARDQGALFRWRALGPAWIKPISGLAVLVVVLVVAGVGVLSYRDLAPSKEIGAERAPSPASAVSVAVLPFLNLSGDSSQEFFSAGMTEEITSTLAKIPDLRVVARTSAFQFKNQNRDIQAIAKVLHATHLVEGSVRKAGTRLRITAQLVNADGITIWTDDYDRELTDVFAIQEDIARAITASLRMPLGLRPGQNLVNNRNIDSDSYEMYLRAKVLVQTNSFQAGDAAGLLQLITAHDPDFAPAWAMLSLAYDSVPQNAAWFSGALLETRRVADDSLRKGIAAAERAIQLDPNLADGYASLGRLQVRRGNPLAADANYSRALAVDPNNPDALVMYGNLLAAAGHLKEAFAVMQKFRALEPFLPIYNANAALVTWLNGDDRSATAILQSVRLGPLRAYSLSEIYASEGNFRAAADELLKLPPGAFRPGIIEEAVRLLSRAPAPTASSVPRLGRLAYVFLYSGSPMRALEFHEDGVGAGFNVAAATALLWHPSYASVRGTDRFKVLVGKLGLVDYWRAKGWPEFCHPTSGDDFVCN